MGSIRNIPMFSPHVSAAATENVGRVLASRWIGQGAEVDSLERALESELSVAHVVAVVNSSAAIRLALAIAGVQVGDEVITTPMTCTLTNHPILEQSAIPVFADVDSLTGNLDPVDVQRRLTDRTRAIICTHWGGTPCDLGPLQDLAERHHLTVIEDASEAIGASYKGMPIGSVSRFTAFSFQAVQILTTGEGGALVVKSEQDARQAKLRRWYGIDRENRIADELGYYEFDITEPGYGYYMTNIAAAIGLANLSEFSALISHRRAIAAQYYAGLKDMASVQISSPQEDRVSSNHFFTLHVERRGEFCRKLKESGIETSIVHRRNDAYRVFGGHRKDLPNLEKFDKSYICLPNHMAVAQEDAERIIDTIRAGW